MSQASADIPHTDLRPPLKVSGYPKLAQYLSKPSDSEHTGSTFKAFRECSTRNILYIEAEMIELIAQQNIFDREDLLGDRDNKRYARSWPLLVRSRDPRHKQRVKHIKKIRRVLKEYHEALILEQSVLRFQRPPREIVEGLKIWSEGENRTDGLGAPQLAGNGRTRLDDAQDLVLLGSPPGNDWLSRFVRRHLKFLFVDREDGTLAEVSDWRMAKAADVLYHIIGTVMAGILLVGAIVNLHYVKDASLKLGLVGFYTGLFTLTVGIMSSARRAELFGSTAAYAAVLVVFVSGNL